MFGEYPSDLYESREIQCPLIRLYKVPSESKLTTRIGVLSSAEKKSSADCRDDLGSLYVPYPHMVAVLDLSRPPFFFDEIPTGYILPFNLRKEIFLSSIKTRTIT